MSRISLSLPVVGVLAVLAEKVAVEKVLGDRDCVRVDRDRPECYLGNLF